MKEPMSRNARKSYIRICKAKKHMTESRKRIPSSFLQHLCFGSFGGKDEDDTLLACRAQGKASPALTGLSFLTQLLEHPSLAGHTCSGTFPDRQWIPRAIQHCCTHAASKPSLARPRRGHRRLRTGQPWLSALYNRCLRPTDPA